MFEFLNTGSKGENIRYCSSKERTVQKEFYDSGNEEPEGCTSIGRRRSLEPREEFFLALCRLRRGFSEKTSSSLVWYFAVDSKQNIPFLDKLHVFKIWSSIYMA